LGKYVISYYVKSLTMLLPKKKKISNNEYLTDFLFRKSKLVNVKFWLYFARNNFINYLTLIFVLRVIYQSCFVKSTTSSLSNLILLQKLFLTLIPFKSIKPSTGWEWVENHEYELNGMNMNNCIFNKSEGS